MPLTFELDPEHDQQLEIHGDAEGLETLRACIDLLLRATPPEHDHLWTASWGGWQLSEEPQRQGARIIHHVKIHRWSD